MDGCGHLIITILQHLKLLVTTILFTDSEPGPKFLKSERASLMREIDSLILPIQQTDEISMKAVQLFAKQVVLILHTCNINEYWAALERLKPPTNKDQSKIRDHPVIYPQVGSVIGWFAGYRTAVVRTQEGNKCRDDLTKAFTKSFPNGQVIIGTGLAYANDRKRKLADVLISHQIENFVQYKKAEGEMINYGPREETGPNVQRIFENSARDWTDLKLFICGDDDRGSVAHIGCIVSAPTLVKDEVLREQLMKHTPNAIGGEMEGWVLIDLKKTLKDQYPKDIEVVVIKGVADYGDLKRGDEWQWTAAKAAVDCIHYCLIKSGGIEFSGKETFSLFHHMLHGHCCIFGLDVLSNSAKG